jgi:hypothetical protein
LGAVRRIWPVGKLDVDWQDQLNWCGADRLVEQVVDRCLPLQRFRSVSTGPNYYVQPRQAPGATHRLSAVSVADLTFRPAAAGTSSKMLRPVLVDWLAGRAYRPLNPYATL